MRISRLDGIPDKKQTAAATAKSSTTNFKVELYDNIMASIQRIFELYNNILAYRGLEYFFSHSAKHNISHAAAATCYQ